MSHHVVLFTSSIKILEKYSLASLVEEMPIDTINSMIRLHSASLLACDTLEKGLALANKILSDASGFSMSVESFISSRADVHALFQIFVEWRDDVLHVHARV